ncbi:hypothetical protein JHK84_034739 [Glycine max]|nr:hypothetical protein JHK85_035115 [Glycine max]KAG4986785.1 hypothetical protein JHK86_034476 [Glycine max]KAG5140971.1 hypothetical protein JHK84_034739 [Glycine max]
MLWHAHLSRFSSFSFDNTTSTVSLSLSLSLFQCFTNHTQGRSEWMRCETSQLITIAFFLPLFLTNLQIPCFFSLESIVTLSHMISCVCHLFITECHFKKTRWLVV